MSRLHARTLVHFGWKISRNKVSFNMEDANPTAIANTEWQHSDVWHDLYGRKLDGNPV